MVSKPMFQRPSLSSTLQSYIWIFLLHDIPAHFSWWQDRNLCFCIFSCSCVMAWWQPTFRAKTTCQVNCNYTATCCVWFKILIYVCDWYTNGDVSYVHGMNVIPLNIPTTSWKYSTFCNNSMTGCKLWSEGRTCGCFEGLKYIDNNIWEKHSTYVKVIFLCNLK